MRAALALVFVLVIGAYMVVGAITQALVLLASHQYDITMGLR